MSRWSSRRAAKIGGERAFTLVELLVVVSIIALLIAILLPSLKKAREQAKVVKCAVNERAIGQSASIYLAEFNAVFPPSYVYPLRVDGNPWSTREDGQAPTPNPYGYMHWSYFLYSSGKIKPEAFQCPNYPSGGAPRTNPGLRNEDWELGEQVDNTGSAVPNELEDRQAPRMAYGPNAAIMPRNKFTSTLSGGKRVNVLVQESHIRRAGDTILATEYLRNWKALGIRQGTGVLSKAHRPINPFFNLSTGYNEYDDNPEQANFLYGPNDPEGQKTYGILPVRLMENKVNVLDYTSGIAQINAVGRHHPGGDQTFGGTANFVFCDGHVELMTPWESMEGRKWGERYYGLNGKTEILNMGKVILRP